MNICFLFRYNVLHEVARALLSLIIKETCLLFCIKVMCMCEVKDENHFSSPLLPTPFFRVLT